MKVLLTLLALSITLTACTGTEPVVSEPIEEVETEAMIYTWEKHGLSLEVPEGLVVSDMLYVDMLVLDSVDRTGFEGELLGQISIRPLEGTLEAYVQERKEESEGQVFQQELVSLGDNSFTKISFYSEFGDYTVTQYLIEEEGVLYSITEGLDENKAETQTVLETLTF